MIINIILAVALIIIIYKYILLKYDVSQLTKQLKYLKKHITSNQTVRTNTHHKDSVKLIKEINESLTSMRNEVTTYKQHELLLNQEITNISHDLRTPLTAIKGYTNLLQDTDSQEDIKKYLNIISNKTNNLIAMINLFHEMTKLNSGDYSLDIKEININELLKEQFLTYFNQFESQSIDVVFKESHPYFVKADNVCLERISTNLISNILKYGKSYVKIEVYDAQNTIQIDISNDTDESFNIGEQTNIFKRSHTLDFSRHNGSTGLGLYMVKRLVEIQQGNISANYLNNEFTITIQLPKYEA